jgi:hypothetical protein
VEASANTVGEEVDVKIVVEVKYANTKGFVVIVKIVGMNELQICDKKIKYK